MVERFEPLPHVDPVLRALGAEAEAASLVALVRKTKPDRMDALVRSMRKAGKLSDFFLLRAARDLFTSDVDRLVVDDLDTYDRLLRFVDRDQGLILPRGNPAQVRSLRDVAAKGLRFVNRQRGAVPHVTDFRDWIVAEFERGPHRLT